MKKNLIRLLAFLIVLSLVLPVLASCALFGGKEDPKDEGNNNQQSGQQGSGEPYQVQIVFDHGDGTSETVDLRVDSSAGVKIPQPADPEKEGFIFLGWYEKGSDTPFDFNKPVTAGVSLTAKWEMETVALEELIPKNVSALIHVDSLGMVVPVAETVEREERVYNEEYDYWYTRYVDEEIITMYEVYLDDDDINVLIGTDEDGELYITAYCPVRVVDEDSISKSVGFVVLYEDHLLNAFFTDGDERTFVKVDLDTILAAISELLAIFDAQIPVADILLGSDELAVPAPFALALDDLLSFEQKKDFLLSFFSVETVEGVDVYTLDYEKLAAINEDLNTLPVSELIDKWFGEATFVSISALIQKALALKVGEALDLMAAYDLTPADILSMICEYAGEELDDATVAQILASIDELDPNETILGVIIDDPQQEAEIKQQVKAFLKLCEEITFYELIEDVIVPMMYEESYEEEDYDEAIGTAPAVEDDEEEYGIYDAICELLEMLQDTAVFSFSVKNDCVVGASLDVNEFGMEIPDLESLWIEELSVELDLDHPTYEYPDRDMFFALMALGGNISKAQDYVMFSPAGSDEDYWSESESSVRFTRDDDGNITGIQYTEYSAYGYTTTEDGRDMHWQSRYCNEYSLTGYDPDNSFFTVNISEEETGYRLVTIFGNATRTYYSYESYYYDDDPTVVYYVVDGEEPTTEMPVIETTPTVGFSFYYNPTTGKTLTTSAYYQLLHSVQDEPR